MQALSGSGIHARVAASEQLLKARVTHARSAGGHPPAAAPAAAAPPAGAPATGLAGAM